MLRRGDSFPYGPVALEPGATVLHHAQTAFEGLNPYRGDDDVPRLFRPDESARRLRASCECMCIPAIAEDLFVDAIEQLVRIDRLWVPNRPGYALYIRPLVSGAEPHLEVLPSPAFRFIVLTCPVASLTYRSEKLVPGASLPRPVTSRLFDLRPAARSPPLDANLRGGLMGVRAA